MFGSFRPFLPWLAVTLLSLLLILAGSNPALDAVRGGWSDLFSLTTAPLSDLIRLHKIWKENQRLRTQLVQMSLELGSVGSKAGENERLRKMLGFASDAPYQVLAARVVGMNPDLGIRGFLIDRGASVGITRNMAAITPDGLVGRICRAGEYTSEVQLLSDPNIGVAGRLQKGREVGMVHADIGWMLTLDGIPVTAKVAPGDSVVTTGMGGIFPEGVIIGTVHDVAVSTDGWLWNIDILPAVDFSRVDELFVVLGKKSGW